MTLNEFNLLDEVKQLEILSSKGVHLGERSNPHQKIQLYQIDSFYVEVFYPLKNNILLRLRSFRSVEQLRPYLDKIDISRFFSS